MAVLTVLCQLDEDGADFLAQDLLLYSLCHSAKVLSGSTPDHGCVVLRQNAVQTPELLVLALLNGNTVSHWQQATA